MKREDRIALRRYRTELRKQQTPLEALRALAAMQKPAQPILSTVTNGDPVLLVGHVQPPTYHPSAANDYYDPVSLALRLERQGIDAIAFFIDSATDPNAINDLALITGAVRCPVIARDTILDEYQVVEARAAGASALILSAALLESAALRVLISATQRNGMAAIVEVENAAQLQCALAHSPHAIALDGRDARSQMLDMVRLMHLRRQLPRSTRALILTPPTSPEELQAMSELNPDAALVDERMLHPVGASALRARFSPEH